MGQVPEKAPEKGAELSAEESRRPPWLSDLLLFLKGVAMGTADAVPGVSGGTIAVMTHIYERLVAAIRSVNPLSLRVWRAQGFQAFWKAIDGRFLLTLALGILGALILMANIVLYLLDQHFVLIMAFFIGLVIASSWFLREQVGDWRLSSYLSVIAGMLLTLLVSLAKPLDSLDAHWYLFFCGVIAICAMILPGLSGAFILILLGVYETVLDALRSVHIDIILVFALGCALGLLSFAHFLNWLFYRYRDQTYAFLTGMLIASVLVLWPWKAGDSGHGGFVSSANLLPGDWQQATGEDPRLLLAVLVLLCGSAVVFIFERVAGKGSR